jgi:pimeloyl-ACP methyl ester carboxylesterase
MPKRKMGDVVVLLPGILGSVLARDKKDVWAVNGGAALRALLSLGKNIKRLQLDDDPIDADDLGDGVTAPRLMPDVHLVPGLWKIDGYTKIETSLAAQYDLEKGKNYFPFPYDWRRDNRVHAARLARESKKWLADWREHSGNKDAKLILLGHSMGGLISRYYLEALDGWRDTRALITFGTPFLGSINAVNYLHHGMKKSAGPITLIDLTDLMRSFTSVHQLLPEYACVDAGAGLVRLADAPAIKGVNVSRFKAFTDFHAEITAQVEAHKQDAEFQAGSYRVHPIVGIRQPTLQSVELRDGKVKALRTYEGEDTDGDGTVPMQSATPIEWRDRNVEMFASERHASLQNFDAVLVQVDGLLRDETVRFRELPTQLSLDLDDMYDVAEPITLGVKADQPDVPLDAVIFDRTNGAEVARASATSDGEWQQVEVPPLPAGTYGVELLGLGAPPADPVHDVFVVFGEDDVTRAIELEV